MAALLRVFLLLAILTGGEEVLWTLRSWAEGCKVISVTNQPHYPSRTTWACPSGEVTR